MGYDYFYLWFQGCPGSQLYGAGCHLPSHEEDHLLASTLSRWVHPIECSKLRCNFSVFRLIFPCCCGNLMPILCACWQMKSCLYNCHQKSEIKLLDRSCSNLQLYITICILWMFFFHNKYYLCCFYNIVTN